MLIFFPLIGVCLMWGYKKFNLAARIVVSAVIVFAHRNFCGRQCGVFLRSGKCRFFLCVKFCFGGGTRKSQGQIGNYICTVKSAEKCKDWNGENAVKITYSFTNNSSDAESFDFGASGRSLSKRSGA